jgi:hypothetical protein
VANLVDRRTASTRKAPSGNADMVSAVGVDEIDEIAEASEGKTEPVVAEAPSVEDALQQLTPEQLLLQTWRLVQNLADALSDQVVHFVRVAMASDDLTGAIGALLFACIQQGTSLSAVEYAVLAECLISVGEDSSLLDYVSVSDVDRQVLFEFVNAPETDEDDAEAAETAIRALDEQVLEQLAFEEGGLLGVWRVWRYPVTAAAYPPATPVYLVETRDDATAVKVAMAYYGQLDESGVPGEAIVEVYGSGTELPALQRAAQFAGELISAETTLDGFQFADVFDGEPGEDGLPQSLEHVTPEEAQGLVDYLLGGTPLLVADSQGEDVLDPSRGEVVPLHLRTDGTWVWSDASAYYLREHLVAPPADFRTHLQTVPKRPARVGDVTLHQVVAWLQSE